MKLSFSTFKRPNESSNDSCRLKHNSNDNLLKSSRDNSFSRSSRDRSFESSRDRKPIIICNETTSKLVGRTNPCYKSVVVDKRNTRSIAAAETNKRTFLTTQIYKFDSNSNLFDRKPIMSSINRSGSDYQLLNDNQARSNKLSDSVMINRQSSSNAPKIYPRKSVISVVSVDGSNSNLSSDQVRNFKKFIIIPNTETSANFKSYSSVSYLIFFCLKFFSSIESISNLFFQSKSKQQLLGGIRSDQQRFD